MEKIWYAIYVKSRTEKKVSFQLDKQGISNYLPLQKVLKQWSDRRKWVEEPLFRSYIFVHIDLNDYYKVLQVNGVVKYISFESKAVPIPPQQIEAIRYFLNGRDSEINDDQKWEQGKQVEVISGSLAGLTGELIEVKGKHKVSVQIEAVNRTILIQIPRNKLMMIH